MCDSDSEPTVEHDAHGRAAGKSGQSAGEHRIVGQGRADRQGALEVGEGLGRQLQAQQVGADALQEGDEQRMVRAVGVLAAHEHLGVVRPRLVGGGERVGEGLLLAGQGVEQGAVEAEEPRALAEQVVGTLRALGARIEVIRSEGEA